MRLRAQLLDMRDGRREVSLGSIQSQREMFGSHADGVRALADRSARQDVDARRAKKLGHEAVRGGCCRAPSGFPICSTTPWLKYHDAVGQRHRLDLVMGDIDHGRTKIAVELCDLQPGVDAQRRI